MITLKLNQSNQSIIQYVNLRGACWTKFSVPSLTSGHNHKAMSWASVWNTDMLL